MSRSDDTQFEATRKLIALKRYETPGEAYFERFLEEFKERQRGEMMKISAWQLLKERLDTWLRGWHGYRWLSAGAGAVAAAVVTTVMMWPKTTAMDDSQPAAPIRIAQNEPSPGPIYDPPLPPLLKEL